MASALFTWGGTTFRAREHAVDRLRRRARHRWPAIDRVGRRPARQSVGAGEEEITLEGVTFPGYAGSRAAVDALRADILAGEPRLLTVGHGDVFGEWVGISVDEAHDRLFDDGLARKITWSLVLAHYGSDDPAGRARASEQAAHAAAGVQGTLAAVEDAAATATTAEDLADVAAAAAGAPSSLLGRVGTAVGQVQDAREQAAVLVNVVRAVAARNGAVSEALSAARGVAARVPGVAQVAPTAANTALATDEGAMIDEIARRVYGSAEPGVVSAVLRATPGLAGRGVKLPAGVRVNLPVVPSGTAARRVARLWT